MHIPLTSTYAAAASAASALGAVVASVTGCVMVRQRIIYKVALDGSPPAAVGSSVKRRAVFFYDTGADNPLALIEIPSPIDDIFKTSGPTAGYEVDLSNTDVIAFNDELLADNAMNPFGDAIVSVVTAYLQSRV